MNLAAAAEVLGAVPAGCAAAWAGRRLTANAAPNLWAMIALEIAVALSAVVAAPAASVPALLVAGWSLGLLAAIDLMVLRLPDSLTLPLGAVGLLLGPRLLGTPLLDHIVGAAAGYGVLALVAFVYARLRGREGLGLGDAKLLAVAGAWLGWIALPTVVVLASAGGLAWAAIRLLRRGRAGLDEPIAFGVLLCTAIWGCLLFATAGDGRIILTWPTS
ncbi:MAG TPA: A24 family peptidase [Phenylobacterium sp.]|jgi:leader peptidase (prepilin peptidase)/N-methyltransferase|nr:A24 family peptidase [Phenylobacterium sp.]